MRRSPESDRKFPHVDTFLEATGGFPIAGAIPGEIYPERYRNMPFTRTRMRLERFVYEGIPLDADPKKDYSTWIDNRNAVLVVADAAKNFTVLAHRLGADVTFKRDSLFGRAVAGKLFPHQAPYFMETLMGFLEELPDIQEDPDFTREIVEDFMATGGFTPGRVYLSVDGAAALLELALPKDVVGGAENKRQSYETIVSHDPVALEIYEAFRNNLFSGSAQTPLNVTPPENPIIFSHDA